MNRHPHADLAERLRDETFARFPMSRLPAIRWRRLRVTAGLANYGDFSISLSSAVLQTEDQVRVTFLHEYAHLLAIDRHGVRAAGHGPAWQRAMLDLGLEPRVHHDYEVRRNEQRQVVTYQCQRCGARFDRSRRLPKGRPYAHARCGGAIHLVGIREAQD